MEKKRWRHHIQWRDHFTQEVKWLHFIQLSKRRCVGLIYKAISYISSKTSKYCKGETNISKDARVAKLVVDAKLILVDAK